MYGGDIDYIKSNLEHHLKTNMSDIVTDNEKVKPKKTHTVERVLNRAFTQVLFAGRGTIELTDVVLSMLNERKSVSVYYLEKGGIEKAKFAEFLNNEIEETLLDDEEISGEAKRALRAFTTNLNDEVKRENIDPIIPPANPQKNAEIIQPIILYFIVWIPIASALSSLSLIALRTNLNLVE